MSLCGCDHCECWCEDCKEPDVYEGPITPEEYRRGKMLQQIYDKEIHSQVTRRPILGEWKVND